MSLSTLTVTYGGCGPVDMSKTTELVGHYARWLDGRKRGPMSYEVLPDSQKEPGSVTSETLQVGALGEN